MKPPFLAFSLLKIRNIAWIVLFFSETSFSLDEIVKKQDFKLARYETVGGKIIQNVRK